MTSNEITDTRGRRGKTLLLVALWTIASVFPLMAATDKAVSGEYTYYGHEGMTMAEARQLALEGAQNEALRDAFGTIVSQDIVQTSEIVNDKEKMAFLSSTQSTVRGEWLGNTGKPEFEESYDNGVPVVKCKVTGRGRKLSNNAPEIVVNALSAPDKRAVSSDFKDSQDIYLYLKSPESDIYVEVCLEDEEGMVYKMFPFETTPPQSVLKKGFDYIFFDPKRPGGDLGEMPGDGLYITTDKLALNRLYVIYSPNKFRRGAWTFNADARLDTMTTRDFNKLMIDLRRNDDEMGMKVINLSVKPDVDHNYESN